MPGPTSGQFITGSTNGVPMPFVNVLDPIDAITILVGNDNKEFALIRLDQPLALTSSLAVSVTVPEPASIGILGGVLALAGLRRRRR